MEEISIERVIEINLPETDFKRTKAFGGFNLNCPFCNGKNKFHIDITQNVARCAKCGDGNDPTKGFNAITLHAKLRGISTSEASKELKSEKNINWKNTKSKEKENQKYKYKVANAKMRNEIYLKFLDNLYISEKHFNSLIKRGLSSQEIKENGYLSVYELKDSKSLVQKIYQELPDEIKAEFEESYSKGIKITVPGFMCLWNRKWMNMAHLESGFTVPVRDLKRRISAFQIRFDDPKDGAKYKWFTSTYSKSGAGVSEINQIHHVGFKEYCLRENKFPETICLTEGALKADIASTLSKKPFIAVMGVSCLKQIPNELKDLKEKGVKNVILCYDMDDDKKEVKAAKNKCISLIQEQGLQVILAKWPKEYKGIDDVLLAKKTNKNIKIKYELI